MKILLWPTCYLPAIGGLEVFVHNLAVELKNRGHQVVVIASGEDHLHYEVEGVEIYSFPFIKALSVFQLREIRNMLARVGEILDEFSFDIVNVHGWFEGFSFYQTRALERRNVPLCITIHGLLEQRSYWTKECQKLWKRAQSISTVSYAMSESLQERGHVHPSLRVIYNGLKVSRVPPVPLPENPLLVMVGRLTEEKCFDVAFHAMKELPGVPLRLVGGGQLYPGLMRLREELGLEKEIEMVGFVPPHEVDSHLDAASLVLVPSHYESFSLVALQAALRGRAVIASDVYGLKEVIISGKTGLLIAPKRPSLLAAAVQSLLPNPEEMGAFAYQRAQEFFSIEKTAENYLTMYHESLCSPLSVS